jgi:hypothetical protein
MYARVVRFTDVNPERIDEIVKQVEENEGPPEGVDSNGMKLFFDKGQGTAMFVGFFESEDKMNDAAKVFEAMDASETPGTRQSVDMCEVVLERDS